MDEREVSNEEVSSESKRVDEENDCRCAEYLSGWKRAQADYANLKRQTDKEKAEFALYANEKLLNRLLPAIDQFEMALAFTPVLKGLQEEDKKKFDNWISGIEAVRASWETVFKDIGLEKIMTEGLFDPLVHEAVSEEPTDDAAEGTVLRCLQSGWRLNGKLLRPARVVVARAKTT
ncbi:MAG: nucleotide exchange factor GrpE [Patescibacteria group bacterium]|nr:nucleotide exchange factor GrpE [Patescibacteria group bacterium]